MLRCIDRADGVVPEFVQTGFVGADFGTKRMGNQLTSETQTQEGDIVFETAVNPAHLGGEVRVLILLVDVLCAAIDYAASQII